MADELHYIVGVFSRLVRLVLVPGHAIHRPWPYAQFGPALGFAKIPYPEVWRPYRGPEEDQPPVICLTISVFHCCGKH